MSSDQRHKVRTLWLTGLLHAFTHLYQVTLMPLYLLIQKDFGFQSVGQATLMVTVMMAATFGPSYPVGILADRFCRKNLLVFGLILNGLGFVGLALAPSYFWALAAVTFSGIGGSFYHPAATAMVARLFPTSTGKALGLVGVGASVGFFFGPIYSGWRAAMIEPVVGAAAWRQPVLELGVLGILVAGLFGWLAEKERPAPVVIRKQSHAEGLFPTPALWFFFLAFCFAFSLRDFAGASMSSLGSLFLQKVHGFDPKWTGLALSGIFIASAISNPLFGGFSDRGRRRWLAIVLVIAAIMMAIFPHVPSRWTVPVFVIYGFFFMASYPMTEAALMESVPDGVRGRVFGIFVMTGGVLGNLSHWAVGAKVRDLGEAGRSAGAFFPIYAGLALLLFLSLSGLLCVNAIKKREHKTESVALDTNSISTSV